jgi:phage N-6-adenine-methyltransferase
MNTKLMFSSKSAEWSTPQKLFDSIDSVCGFELDVCATHDNAKCKRYYTVKDDALSKFPWKGVCWLNPPYGRGIEKWMDLAHWSAMHGSVIVCLVPARTDTAWWHNYAVKGDIIFLRGRIKFSGHKNCAPFPSAIVIFGGNFALATRIKQKLIDDGIW